MATYSSNRWDAHSSKQKFRKQRPKSVLGFEWRFFFGSANYASTVMWCVFLQRMPPIGSCLVKIRGLNHAEVILRMLHGCVSGGLSQGYVHDGPGVCLVDGQTEAYLKDMCMTGLASAWAMSSRGPKEYRCRVNAATRCSGVCPHTWPELIWIRH